MLLINKNITKILPIVRLEFYKNENSLIISTNLIKEILTIIKNHYNYQFKILTCISGVDYPENSYRFQIVYEFLSLKFNTWIWIKILTDELNPIESIKKIFLNSECWESEIWDMFGVYFIQQYNLIRPLTDYGFIGFPLWKDFPLNGFTEIKYSTLKKWIVFEKIEFSNEFKAFQFISPWTNKNAKINNKR